MVDLGFTIIHQCDEHFEARIRAGAPRDGVPDVAAAEAEEIAEAYMRYSCLIGIAQPCDEAGMAACTADALIHPDLADSGHFIYEESWSNGATADTRPSALIFMRNWSQPPPAD